MSRPCSIQLYQVEDIPQSWATSSRRSPGVLLRPEYTPASAARPGVRASRASPEKGAEHAALIGRKQHGGTAYTRIKFDLIPVP